MLIDGEAHMATEVETVRRLFTRAEYHRMAEAGILGKRDRVELIRGEIVRMSPIGRRHVAFNDTLIALLMRRVDERAIVSVAGGVVLSDDTEPEPDIKILRRNRDVPYKEREVHADDLVCVIEVSDSSLSYDRRTKLRLYAEAGIPEYWIVDCEGEAVEVHRRPEGSGYRDVTRVVGADATVSLEAFPDVTLRLADIFA